MRLLLTGADGFTGRHVASAAIAQGIEVFPLAGDLQNRESIKAQVQEIEPTHVLHLAAISHVMHADEQGFYQTNLFGSLHLLDALLTLKQAPQKVILASSANVYGHCEHSPIDESQVPAPVNHYAMSKLAMELLSRNYLSQLPIAITRPFNYTGVGHHVSFVIPKIIEHFVRKADHIELGNIEVYREYNDVRDVSQCYLGLLALGVSGQTYNLASGRTVNLRQVISLLESMTGHLLPVKVNPKLVRNNEIEILSGNHARLEQCLGPQHWRPLEQTLQWMLDAAQ